MTIQDRLETDLRKALKAGDKLSLSVLRMILADLKNERIRKGSELSETEEIQVLMRGVKTRRQSIEEFKKGKREDLVSRESKEVEIIERYLPAKMSDLELEKIILTVIQESGAKSPSEVGKVIGLVMAKVKGKAEGQQVSAIVKERLLTTAKLT